MTAAVVGALLCASVLLAWPSRRPARPGERAGSRRPGPQGAVGVGPDRPCAGPLRAWRARFGGAARAEEETDALIEIVEALDAALAAGATPLEALVSVDRVRSAVRGEGAAFSGAGRVVAPGVDGVVGEGPASGTADGIAGGFDGGFDGGRGDGSAARPGGGRRASGVEAALPILIARARVGDGLAAGWADVAARLHSPQLDLLARAWALSEASGASLAAAARTAVHLLRSSRDERRRTEAAVAGARATMTVLTMLPLGGPLLAFVVGLDPGRVYLGSPATALMLGGGVVLVLVGRWWVDRLVAAALRGPGLS